MITALLLFLLVGLCAGISASIYRKVLGHEPILNWWFMIGQRYEGKWFFKPVWGCHRCIAGQLSLWGVIITWVTAGFPLHWIPFLFCGLIASICVAIYTSMLTNHILNNIKD